MLDTKDYEMISALLDDKIMDKINTRIDQLETRLIALQMILKLQRDVDEIKEKIKSKSV